MTASASLLSASGLTVAFGGLRAVDSVDLEVAAGSIHALIGPNGAGKSTAVNAITGFVRIAAGSLRLGGREIAGCSAHRIASYGLARTFQNIRLFSSMTVLETVLVGAHQRLAGSPFSSVFFRRNMAAKEKDAVADARELLDFVGLSADVADRFATTLSYGHQRRVEIARCLMAQPRLILLDEPLAGMNAAEKDEIAGLIRQVRDRGATVILVEHDMQIVRALADHVTVLDHGQRLADGAPASVFGNEEVQSAYFGRSRA